MSTDPVDTEGLETIIEAMHAADFQIGDTVYVTRIGQIQLRNHGYQGTVIAKPDNGWFQVKLTKPIAFPEGALTEITVDWRSLLSEAKHGERVIDIQNRRDEINRQRAAQNLPLLFQDQLPLNESHDE